jgi:hypothetical protein
MDSERLLKALPLFRVRIGQPGQASYAHPHRQVLSFHMTGRDFV